MQVVTHTSRYYKASFLEYDCEVRAATLNLIENEITRNQFIGPDSTFIYINGGIVDAQRNIFEYNGLLRTDVYSSDVENFDREFYRSTFPWLDYSFTKA